ncbi:MAG: polysaccharide deacetylase family protein [Burkholderiaceae bacterium]
MPTGPGAWLSGPNPSLLRPTALFCGPLRALTALASPGGPNGRLAVFTFHRVPAAPDPLFPYEPDRSTFASILDWIGEQFRVLAPYEGCRRLYAGRLPPRAAMLTFDDGYRDNFEVAMPLLRARGLSAAFFIATGYSGGRPMFNDRIVHAIGGCRRSSLKLPWPGGEVVTLDGIEARRRAIDRIIAAVKYLPSEARERQVDRLVEATEADAPPDLMMTREQIAALAAQGMEIGGHTRWHPILQSLPAEQAEGEIEQGRADLAEITGRAPRLFAYPNGKSPRDYGPIHRAFVARAGFEFAFTTEGGAASAATDPFRIPRHTPWSRYRPRFGWQAYRNLVS